MFGYFFLRFLSSCWLWLFLYSQEPRKKTKQKQQQHQIRFVENCPELKPWQLSCSVVVSPWSRNKAKQVYENTTGKNKITVCRTIKSTWQSHSGLCQPTCCPLSRITQFMTQTFWSVQRSLRALTICTHSSPKFSVKRCGLVFRLVKKERDWVVPFTKIPLSTFSRKKAWHS